MSVNIYVAYGGNTIATLSNQSSVPIVYDGDTLATITGAGTKTLNCAGKLMTTDVEIGSKVLNCAGKVMSTDVVITAENAIAYLIYNGTAYVTFTANNIPNSSSYAKRNPTVGSGSNAITLAQPSKSSGNGYGGSYATGRFDLSAYTYLTVEYNITTTGTVNNAIKTRVVLYANAGGLPSYQNQATVSTGAEYKAKVTSTNQSLTITLPSNKSDLCVGIGVNNMNISIAATVSVKNVYLYN